jgi:hypothetical protein
MSESPHPAIKFAATLKELAEGRMDAESWLAWWTDHAGEVEATCPRGWFLKLKPRQVDSGANRAAFISQCGAFSILEALNVPFTPSDRYQRAWTENFRKFCIDKKQQQSRLAEQFEPRISVLAANYPKLATFLKKRVESIDCLGEPATESETSNVERSLGVSLPRAFRRFLGCTRALTLDGIAIGLEQVFRHPALIGDQAPGTENLCIADYALEADGDQVLFDLRSALDDPPVYYYAHAAARKLARPLAPSFTAWLESLPKSPLFRD